MVHLRLEDVQLRHAFRIVAILKLGYSLYKFEREIFEAGGRDTGVKKF